MKDRLGSSAWVNRAPRNRTQTIYTRFLKGPSGELTSQFTKIKSAFESRMHDALKTPYTEELKG